MKQGLIGEAIVFSATDPNKPPPPPDTNYRAVHQIRLSAIRHNYACVESAAARQRCSVIVVVKADGYGHGAVESAIHLADHVGADAFAVATLEEGIALRKAFETTLPLMGSTTTTNATSNSASSSLFTQPQPPITNATTAGVVPTATSVITFDNKSQASSSNNSVSGNYLTGNSITVGAPRSLRPPQIRIFVLGPPVGYPRCFDDYYHHNIEVMCSGPEVARALMEWITDEKERKRTQVERAANDTKAAALMGRPAAALRDTTPSIVLKPILPVPPPVTATTTTTTAVGDDPLKALQIDANHFGNQNNIEETEPSTSKSENHQKHPRKLLSRVESYPVNATEGNKPFTQQQVLPPPPPPQQQQQPLQPFVYREPTLNATLGNVSGQDLAKEVRAYLMNQQAAKEQSAAAAALLKHPPPVNHHTPNGSIAGTADMTVSVSSAVTAANTSSSTTTMTTTAGGPILSRHNSNNLGTYMVPAQQVFGGIEALAKSSRTREIAAARANGIFREDSGDDFPSSPNSDDSKSKNASTSTNSSSAPTTTNKIPPAAAAAMTTNLVQAARKRRLRYHISVDSGMGRLGFKTQPVEVSDVGIRRDTVEIINELVEMEVAGAPIEFYGMCTHMADASSTSTYTQDQMNRFKGLLRRVRATGISIPTVSTDNSAALLTTTLTHFDAKALLSQPHVDTRGFVRTGGAVYGQRPAFKQLRAVSTLLASVRHVAVLKQGESVGYDRAYIAPMNVRIATLTIGFADGYPRDLGNGVGKVAIRGHLFPVAGNVCMDMLMVELGPADDKTGPGAEVVVGDTAVLWGPSDENDGDGLVRLQDVAATLKTTQSALTCGLNKIRVLRQYV